MIPTRRRLLAAGGLTAALVLAGCGRGDELGSINGIPLTGQKLGETFTLTDTHGQTRTIADFQGKPLLVFFGFTQCPDVCPTALLRAAEVKRMLGEDGERLQVAFITVDPERDTPEVLQAYVTAFDPSFIGLYGTLKQTEQTMRDFKGYYAKVPTGDSYTMDHTALSYVYDAKGQIRLALRHTQSAQEFADDIRKVLALG
ncbi:Cytochrome oxidase biogenesis protein Sco1/SenC/PrrC, putative copper metallochaperone [plant metagenome]|uniref:Cytochrome oxidase biogenesis protein Sco1/SenC/PrrC, putative copper metallochaperone n=1 Tax=plant metagenome TaxID=1297885 RepID=A0A484UFC3_9ZZZZ